MGSLEHIDNVEEIGTWPGEIPVRFAYTAGVAGERFLRELKESGRLLATRCSTCRYTYLPPRLYCERCLGELSEWLEAGPQGTVQACTAVYQDMEGRPLEAPVTVALIQLDGADGLLVHRVTGDVKNGTRVEPVLKPPAKRQGSITDIDHFRPIGT